MSADQSLENEGSPSSHHPSPHSTSSVKASSVKSAEPKAAIESGLPKPSPTALISTSQGLIPDLSKPQIRTLPLLEQLRQKGKRWEWLIVWVITLCIFGGMGTSAFLWLTGLPPLPNCGETIATFGMQRLYCAQQTARSGKLPDLITGIALLKDWSPDQPFYEQAQQLVDEWSALVLLGAQSKINQHDLQGAIAAANQVPVSSPVYEDAQKAIATWKAQWHKGDVLYARAEVAIRAQNWKEAAAQVAEMGYMEDEYWRIDQADALAKRILAEKAARQAVTQAQKLAKGNDPNKLGDAIALVQDVPSGTLAFPEAKAALTQWSQTLLDWALQQWQQGNADLALTTAEEIPFDPNFPQAGRDLIHLSQAQQRTRDLQQQPLAAQLWNLLEATSAAQQIPANSPFYQAAQSQNWQAQLQDMIQLQFADALSQWGDSSSLNLAIAQAQQISPDRPGRLTAQSLIAHWHQELQKLEDRPYLVWAEQMAKSGTIADLKRAIAQAQEIPSDRALWSDAQAKITEWGTQIEVIEDQPVLDQAKQLAKQNKYPEAIQMARKIQPDRALYEAAQTNIKTWQAEITKVQTAQDQPILNQANALADRGRLTMAIDLASQIAPGRALYDQAQYSIKVWMDERQSIWNAESSTGSSGDNAGDGSSAPQ
ncbi:MAG TPA: hypothetical protein V6C57_13970 [Coleofasciculaceae cyanobacterium]